MSLDAVFVDCLCGKPHALLWPPALGEFVGARVTAALIFAGVVKCGKLRYFVYTRIP